MKIKTLQLFLFISRLILTVALMVIIFSKVSPNSIWQVLATANQFYILLAGALLFLFDTVIPGVLGSLFFSFQPKSYAKKNKSRR